MRMLSFWNGVVFSDFLKIRCKLRNTIAITTRMITAPMPNIKKDVISTFPFITGALTSKPYTSRFAPQHSFASKPTKQFTQFGATTEQTVAAIISITPTQWNTSKIFVMIFPSLFITFILHTSKAFDNESISEILMFVNCFLMFYIKLYIFIIKTILNLYLPYLIRQILIGQMYFSK